MRSLLCGLIILISAINVSLCDDNETTQRKEPSPLFEVVLCPFRTEPWTCVREQASRTLKELSDVVAKKSTEFKAEADAEIAAKMQARGFSASESDPRQKPSFVMQTVEDTLDTISESVEDLMADEYEGRKDKNKKDKKDKKDKDKKKKKKTKKKKKKPQHHEQDDEWEEDEHEVVEWEDDDLELEEYEVAVPSGGTKRKHGQETGRLIGEKRGKKKKKKKAIMKLLLLGAVLKGKIELLLKLMSAHLQMKFFAIAVFGLLINLARFWVDVKKGHQPQKVIYYEHAQHQHHYDDHGDDWGGGGYWKRSFNAPENEDGTYYSTDHNNTPPTSAAFEGAPNGFELSANRQQQPPFPYNHQPESDQQLAYSQQAPQARY